MFFNLPYKICLNFKTSIQQVSEQRKCITSLFCLSHSQPHVLNSSADLLQLQFHPYLSFIKEIQPCSMLVEQTSIFQVTQRKVQLLFLFLRHVQNLNGNTFLLRGTGYFIFCYQLCTECKFSQFTYKEFFLVWKDTFVRKL